MNRKHIVRLADAERRACDEVVKRLKWTSQKVRRVQILLKADAESSPHTWKTCWKSSAGSERRPRFA